MKTALLGKLANVVSDGANFRAEVVATEAYLDASREVREREERTPVVISRHVTGDWLRDGADVYLVGMSVRAPRGVEVVVSSGRLAKVAA